MNAIEAAATPGDTGRPATVQLLSMIAKGRNDGCTRRSFALAPDGVVALLDLAAAGGLTLARSGCHRDGPDSAPRAAWWARAAPDGGCYEISGSTFRVLLRLGVPVVHRSTRGPPPGRNTTEPTIKG
jgi:hypothetical protein